MPLVQTQTTSFKAELPQAVHNLLTDTIKFALYTALAGLNEATTVYTTSNEVVGTGYTAGGLVTTGWAIGSSGLVAYATCANAIWTGALTARGGLLYNASKGNKAVAVIDFGADKTSNTVFTVQMPINGPTSGLLRW